MPYIEQIPPEDATGQAKREYEAAMRRAGRIWNIVAIQSQNGAVMRDSMRLYGSAMREMIAVVTSQANNCHY
jgi:alkylhydroperoxidase family enzyme